MNLNVFFSYAGVLYSVLTAGGLNSGPHISMQNLQNVSQLWRALEVRLPSCSRRTSVQAVTKKAKHIIASAVSVLKSSLNLLPERISGLGLELLFRERVSTYVRLVCCNEVFSIKPNF